jgi:hypothetical protein
LSSSYGNSHDYTLVVIGSECIPQTGLAAFDITDQSANINWTSSASTPDNGYDIYLATDETAPDEYTVPTDNTSDTVYSFTGLTGFTAYRAWVRANCGNETSLWLSVAFMTAAVETYGNGEWNGYVYSAPSERQFGNFLGTVNEPAQFSRNKTPESLQAGPWTGVNPNFTGTPPSDNFSARYRMTYNFTGSNYMFIIDADEHFRLSVDGGQTWLPFTRDNTTTTSPDNWSTNCCSPWHSATVAITGSNDLVLEFYEASNGAYLDFSFINMDCQAPTNVAATNITMTNAEISWTGINEAVDYTIEVCAPGETPGNGNIYSNPNATSPVSIIGLSAATVYTVYVKSNCADGESAFATASFTTLPNPTVCNVPTALNHNTVTDVSATITWTAGGTETQWQIAWKKTAISSWDPVIGVATNSYNLSGLDAATGYDVRVRAICAPGDTSNWTAIHSFTTLQIICNTPTNLHASDTNEHSISIAWTPVNGETEWEVSWAISENVGNATVNGSPAYLLTDLLSDTVYQICVKAICSDAVQSADTCIEVRTKPVGINDIPLASGVKLYPNPASEQLTIDMESRFNTVEVTSTLGQVVYRANLTETRKVIDVTGYSAGMYYVRLQGEAGTVTKKFVKR